MVGIGKQKHRQGHLSCSARLLLPSPLPGKAEWDGEINPWIQFKHGELPLTLLPTAAAAASTWFQPAFSSKRENNRLLETVSQEDGGRNGLRKGHTGPSCGQAIAASSRAHRVRWDQIASAWPRQTCQLGSTGYHPACGAGGAADTLLPKNAEGKAGAGLRHMPRDPHSPAQPPAHTRDCPLSLSEN